MSTKPQLRKRFLDIRAAWSQEDRERRSASMVTRIAGLPEVRTATCVLAYWPMPHRFEVDLEVLLEDLVKSGVAIGLPVVSFDRADTSLVFRRFEGRDRMVTGPFGTCHPGITAPVEPTDANVIIVPALAADRTGLRLGWGGGYYDRLLAGLELPSICPVYSDCLVDSLEEETHDRRISIIVTESETIRPAGRP